MKVYCHGKLVDVEDLSDRIPASLTGYFRCVVCGKWLRLVP